MAWSGLNRAHTRGQAGDHRRRKRGVVATVDLAVVDPGREPRQAQAASGIAYFRETLLAGM
jgi:hypothetical protein